jgi:phage tail sheath gpL-like
MAGFQLTGVDPADPIPGIIREIKFAQGVSAQSSAGREVVLVANQLAAGSETEETLGDAIVGSADCIARFGQKSEMFWQYKCYTAIDQAATIYGISPTAGTGTATVDVTFVGDATANTTLKFTMLGEEIQVGVVSGDAIATIAAALAAKINAQIEWPLGTATSALGVTTIPVATAGYRHGYILETIRAAFTVDATTTVSVGTVTDGATDDDHGNALAVLEGKKIYYQVSAKANPADPDAAADAISSSDGGMGEHCNMIDVQAQPVNGKSQQVFFGLVDTQAKATTVATGCNTARAKFFRCENSDWTPGMIAAHCAAAHRVKEIGHPSANMTDYGQGEGEIFNIPKPYAASDMPTQPEIRADLNNGVTPIDWTPSGQAFIVRSITSRSLQGSINDYRVREGHIPSAIDYYWETLFTRYFTSKQDFVADDPKKGSPPLAGVTYPRDVKALHNNVIDDLINYAGGPVLDPSYWDAMKTTFACVRLTDGISCRSRPIASKHNNKGQFLIEESSEAY